MSARIFVTGATGLVGLHVTKQLLAAGHDVVAAVRLSSKTESLKRLPTTDGQLKLFTCDLGNRDALKTGMRDCQVVVHCAGAVDPHARREDIVATNVDGTRNALKAAIENGCQQFIHISSLSVITGQEDQYAVDETAPLRYCGEAYADSKVDAEKVVQQVSSGKINFTILRPGFIYGPGEQAWMPRLIGSIATGKAMLIDGGKKETNVVYVENLSRAVELAMLNDRAYGQTYNLTDGKTPSKKELFDAIADGLGLPRVSRSIPRPLAKIVCELVSSIAPFLSIEQKKSLSRFSRAAFRLAAVNQGFSVRKAEQELGYINLVPFQQGMAATLQTFRKGDSAPRELAVH